MGAVARLAISLRDANRASRGRKGSHLGSRRSLETDVNTLRCRCKWKVRRYWRMISGMLMRSAAEKFFTAISAWCSGFCSRAIKHLARL